MLPTISDFHNHDFNAGNLTSDGGLLLLTTFIEKTGAAIFFKNLPFNDNRLNPSVTNEDILFSRMISVFVGNSHNTCRHQMKNDPLFDGITLPSQSTESRFYRRITDETIKMFSDTLSRQAVSRIMKTQKKVVLDQDSTVVETFGNQEFSGFIKHYDTSGYHPLLISEAHSDLILGAWLRPGNSYASMGAWEQLKPVLDQLMEDPEMEIVYRADSAGCDSVFLSQLEGTHRVKYFIREKNTSKFVREVMEDMAEKGIDFNDYSFDKPYVSEILYSINKTAPRRVVYKAYQKTGKNGQLALFPQVFGVVTNDSELSCDGVLETYEGRGDSENVNRDVKNDFGAGTLSHSSLLMNSLDFLLCCFCYNLYKIFAKEILEGSDQNMTMGIFRTNLGKVAARVIRHARRRVISFAANFWNKTRFSYYFEKVRAYSKEILYV